MYFLNPCFPFGWSGISAWRVGVPLINIFCGFSTKKYLGTFSRYFLFSVYRTSTGILTFVFLTPIPKRNSLTASGFIPLSLRDCRDHSRGSFHPEYVPAFTSALPFDLDIFTPSIANSPL